MNSHSKESATESLLTGSQTSLSDWLVYRRLLGYTAEFRWTFALSILGFALYASTAPMLAHLMEVIERAVREPMEATRWLLCGSLVGIFALRGLGTFLGTYCIARVSRGIVHLIRSELFGKLLKSPTAFFDSESSGTLISRITYDVEQVASAASTAVTTFVREGLTVVFLIGYMLYVHWQLTLVFLIAAPFIGVVVGQATGYFKKYSRRVRDTVAQVTQITQEAITGYKEVKNFGGYEYEETRFFEASERNFLQHLKYVRTSAISVPLIQLFVAMAIALLVWIALSPDFLQSMSAGEFFAFFTAATTLAKPLRVLASLNSTVQRGIVGAQSAFSLMDMPKEPDEGQKTLTQLQGYVRFDHLYFQYATSEQSALNGVTLEVSPGQSLALVGRSGSGKTTLMSLLARFYEPTQGQIYLDGTDISELSLSYLRSQIALVSQRVTLFNGTVAENIAYGELAHATRDDIERVARLAYADEFIQQLPEGYDTPIGDDGSLLSGGQRQRIAIARALLKDAPILILDEATSALDNESELYVQQAIETLMQGRTTFIIAHRLSTVEQVDRIVVLDQGKVIEAGEHHSLLAQQGAYARLQASELAPS